MIFCLAGLNRKLNKIGERIAGCLVASVSTAPTSRDAKMSLSGAIHEGALAPSREPRVYTTEAGSYGNVLFSAVGPPLCKRSHWGESEGSVLTFGVSQSPSCPRRIQGMPSRARNGKV